MPEITSRQVYYTVVVGDKQGRRALTSGEAPTLGSAMHEVAHAIERMVDVEGIDFGSATVSLIRRWDYARHCYKDGRNLDKEERCKTCDCKEGAR